MNHSQQNDQLSSREKWKIDDKEQMCVRHSTALRICYSVLYLDVKWIFHTAHSIVYHFESGEFQYMACHRRPLSLPLFISYSLHYSKLNTHTHTPDKMCIIKNIIGWIKLENVILLCHVHFSVCLSLRTICFWISDYPNSIEHCYDNMNDIHSNEMFGYMPFLLLLQL